MDCGGIYLFNQEGSLDLMVDKGLAVDFKKEVSRFEPGSDNVKLVLAGKPVYTNHQKLDVTLSPTERMETLRAIAVIPVSHQNQTIGCINVASHSLGSIPNQSRIALETSGSQIGGLIAEIQNREALLQSEERYRELFDYMSSGVAIYEPVENGEDFIFKAFNQAAEKITQISRKKTIGNRLLELFPHMEKSGLLGALQRVWKSGMPEHLPPFYYKLPSGECC